MTKRSLPLTVGLILLFGISGWLAVAPVAAQGDQFAFEDEFNNATAIQYLNVGVLMASNLGARLIFNNYNYRVIK